jgi:hypothetical protein
MTRRLPFTEAAIARVVRGAKKAGAEKVIFDSCGQVTVHCGEAPAPDPVPPAADPAACLARLKAARGWQTRNRR